MENFRSYSADHLSCDVSFLYQIAKGRKTYDYPSSYTLYFVQKDGAWKIASMEVK